MSVTATNFLESNLQVVLGATLSQVRATAQDVEVWISKLPLLDVGRSSQQLLTLLNDLAVADIDDQTRLEILEVCRKPLKSITQSLSKHFFIQKIQLDQLSDRIFDLNTEFRALQSQIYFYIAQRLTEKLQTSNFGLLAINKKKVLQNQIGQAVHRGITELTHLLFDHVMLYRAAPSKLWARLHYLYMLACRIDLQNNAFFDTQLKFSRKSTINQAYNAAILLSLFDTGRLRQADIQNVYALIEHWAPMVDITETPTANSLLMVNPFTDSAPLYMNKNSTIGHRFFFFDLSQIHDFINSNRFLDKSSEQYSYESTLSSAIIKYIKEIVTIPLERAAKRHKVDNEYIDVFFGINTIHYQLTGQMFNEFSQNVGYDNKRIETTAGFDVLSSEDIFANKTTIIDTNNIDTLSMSYRCRVENISTGGIGMRWTQPDEIKALKTGELVLYKEIVNQQWTVGIVRWLRRHPDLSIEFGVQTLSSEVTACMVDVHLRNQPHSECLRGFILTDSNQQLHPNSLITSPFAFRATHVVTLALPNSEATIELGNLILESSSFMQHLFTMNEDVTALTGKISTVTPEAEIKFGSEHVNHFDDLWKKL